MRLLRSQDRTNHINMKRSEFIKIIGIGTVASITPFSTLLLKDLPPKEDIFKLKQEELLREFSRKQEALYLYGPYENTLGTLVSTMNKFESRKGIHEWVEEDVL